MANVTFLGALPEGTGIPVVTGGANDGQRIYTSPLIGGEFLLKGPGVGTGGGQLMTGLLKVAGGFYLDIKDIKLPEIDLLLGIQAGDDLHDLLSHVLKGNDTVSGNHVDGQVLRGYGGNDTYLLDREDVAIDEEPGGGIDTAIASYFGDVYLSYGVENLIVDGPVRLAYCNKGANTVWLETAGATVFTEAGNDTVHGSEGNDTAVGGSGIDRLYGDAGSDYLWGEDGNDALYGGSGGDGLVGGLGRDALAGGAGLDNFQYKLTTDSRTTAATRDVIQDFVDGTARAHETISFTDLRHNGAVVDWYPWSFKGTGRFDTSGVPQIRYSYNANTDQTIIQISVDRDVDAEMSIALVGRHTLHEYNFVF